MQNNGFINPNMSAPGNSLFPGSTNNGFPFHGPSTGGIVQHRLPAPTNANHPNGAPRVGGGVSGGGAAAQQTTRIRWSRLLLAAGALALIAAGAWTVANPSSNSPTRAVNHAAPTIESSTIAPDNASDQSINDVDLFAAPNASADPVAPATPTAPVAPATPKMAAKKKFGAKAHKSTGKAASVPAADRAAAQAQVVNGGGNSTPSNPSGELPYTGLETWIAAILGTVILALGILIQFNAVRIGMTAMLYRRGILLRPVDCARLAKQRGIPAARVWISDALHWLLKAPANQDFVSAS